MVTRQARHSLSLPPYSEWEAKLSTYFLCHPDSEREEVVEDEGRLEGDEVELCAEEVQICRHCLKAHQRLKQQ